MMEDLTLYELYMYWKNKEEQAYESFDSSYDSYYYGKEGDNVFMDELIHIISTRQYYEDRFNEYYKKAMDELREKGYKVD